MSRMNCLNVRKRLPSICQAYDTPRSAQVKCEIKGRRSNHRILSVVLWCSRALRFTAQLRKRLYYENSLVPFYDDEFMREKYPTFSFPFNVKAWLRPIRCPLNEAIHTCFHLSHEFLTILFLTILFLTISDYIFSLRIFIRPNNFHRCGTQFDTQLSKNVIFYFHIY